MTAQLFRFSIGLPRAFDPRSLWCPKTFAAMLGKVYLLYRSTLQVNVTAVEYLSAGYTFTSKLASMFYFFCCCPKDWFWSSKVVDSLI